MQVYYESDPDDTADVILLDHDVRQIRCVHVRLQEQLQNIMYTYNLLYAVQSLLKSKWSHICNSVQYKHDCLYNLPAAEGF